MIKILSADFQNITRLVLNIIKYQCLKSTTKVEELLDSRLIKYIELEALS